MLAGAGTLAVGGTAFMVAGSQPASAQATVTELQLDGAEHSGDDGSVESVSISVSGSFSYTTNGATDYSIDLQVAGSPDSEDWQSIDWQDDTALANSSGGSYELSGSVLDASMYEAQDFSAGAAETVTTDVPVRVYLRVMNGENAVAEAIAETVATVSVTNESVAVSAEVSGDGSVSIAV